MNEANGLPKGWTVAPLAQIGEWYGGGTPSKANPAYWDGGTIPWFSPKDMKKFRLINSEDHVTLVATKETNVTRFPQGTILIVVRSGILVRTLPVAICEASATMNQDMKGLRPFEDIDPAFVAYFLTANERSILQECSKDGTTVASIEVGRLKSFHLPIPPFNEQRRIVAKIEELFSDLDAAVVALERVQAKLKRYRAAVLKAAVEGKLTAEWRAQHPNTEPATVLLGRILAERRRRWEEAQLARFDQAGKEPPKNWREKYQEPAGPDTSTLPKLPEGWCWASLEHLVDAVRPICYGILMPKENVRDGVLYVKVKDMKGDRIDLDNLHQTRNDIAAAYARASLKTGDLLLAIRGTYGRVAVVPPELEGGNITQDTARLAVLPGLIAQFVASCLRSQVCQLYFKKVARGVAVRGVNIADVKTCPVPLAPVEEQHRIVDEIEQQLSTILEIESQVDANLKRAARLRQAILKRAFEGRLVPQDPTDEPAEKLLERIRAATENKRGNGRFPARCGRSDQPTFFEDE